MLSHGHNHPRILAARTRYQAAKRMEVHKIVFSPYHGGAGAQCGDAASSLNKCFFPNSGAEAVEGAMKVAFKSRRERRQHILYAEDSFRQADRLNITGSQASRWISAHRQHRHLPPQRSRLGRATGKRVAPS